MAGDDKPPQVVGLDLADVIDTPQERLEKFQAHLDVPDGPRAQALGPCSQLLTAQQCFEAHIFAR